MKITICYRVRIHAFVAIFIDCVCFCHARIVLHFDFIASAFPISTTFETTKHANIASFLSSIGFNCKKECGKMPLAFGKPSMPLVSVYSMSKTAWKLKCILGLSCLKLKRIEITEYSTLTGNCFVRETIISLSSMNSFKVMRYYSNLFQISLE